MFHYLYREAQTFPTLLTVSIELLLQACDDADADVRLMAGEALNRIIKVRYQIKCKMTPKMLVSKV